MNILKKLLSHIGLINESLLVINLWIFLYNQLLRFLDSRFPPILPKEFIRTGAVPEPYEISLYLFLSVSFIIAVWLLHTFVLKHGFNHELPQKYGRFYILLKFFTFLLLLLLLMTNIGSYPMVHDPYPHPLQDSRTYSIYLSMYLATMVVILIETAILSRLIQANKKIFFLFFAIIVTIIAVATFEPGFPIVGHDYSYFLGPIWEVVNGKTIYTQASSQYGFFSILFFSLLYKFNLFSPWYFPAIVWTLYIVQYSICLYLIYKVSNSVTLAVLGLFSILTVNYFSIYTLPATFPQVGPLRWLPLFVFLLLFYKVKRIDSKILIAVLPLLSFWVIDSGISLLFTYVFTLLLLVLIKQLHWLKGLKALLWLLLSFIITLTLVNIFHLVLGYKPVHIFFIFSKLKEYANYGFGMIPLDPYSYFWIVVSIYFLTLIYILRSRALEYRHQLILLAANLSLFASIYFVGRSHPHNLFHISIFILTNLFLLIGMGWQKIDSTKIKFLLAVVIFLLTIFYPAFERQEVLTEMMREKIRRYTVGKIFMPEAKELLDQKYKNEIHLIQRELPEPEILMLSADDTYLFYLTGKKNLMMDNSQVNILTQKDMDFSLQKVFASCPKKIVIDCQFMGKCTGTNPFVSGSFSIQPLLLNRIQDVCKVTYQPVKCTNQLCIAGTK